MHFIVVVEINAESFRATKELNVLLLKVFLVAL